MTRSIILILLTVSLIISGQLLLKEGVSKAIGSKHSLKRFGPSIFLQYWRILVGLCIYGCSFLIWLYVLSVADLSFAYPFLSIAYIGVPLAANLFLNERITIAQWLGIVLVVTGVLLVASSG